jgi:hypothetical protein
MPTYSGFIVSGDDTSASTSTILNSISDGGTGVLQYVRDFTNYPASRNNAVQIKYTTSPYNQLITANPVNKSIVFTDTGSTSIWNNSSGGYLQGFISDIDMVANSLLLETGTFDTSGNTTMVACVNASNFNFNIEVYYNRYIIDNVNTWTAITIGQFGSPVLIKENNGYWLLLNYEILASSPTNPITLFYNTGSTFSQVNTALYTIPAFDEGPGTYAMEYGKLSSSTSGWILASNDSTNSLWKSGDPTGAAANWTQYTGIVSGVLFSTTTTILNLRWDPTCMATDGNNNWVIGYSAGMGNTPGSQIGIVYSIDYGQTFADAEFGSSIPSAYVFVCYGISYGTVLGNNYFVATGQMFEDNTLSLTVPAFAILQSSDGVTWEQSNIIAGLFSTQGFDVIYTEMDVVCLLKGSKVKTPEGYMAIETLAKGDTILMPNGLEREIVDIPRQTVPNEPHLSPYIIPAGKLGATEDLYLSPTHSVFINGKFIEAQFLGYKRASLPDRAIEYYNISLGGFRDELLDAQGVPIESLGKPFNGTEKPFYEKVAVRKDLSKDSIYPEDVRNGLIAKLQKESPYTVSELQTFSDQELRYILLGDNVDLL